MTTLLARLLSTLDTTGTLTLSDRALTAQIHSLRPHATLEQLDSDWFRFDLDA